MVRATMWSTQKMLIVGGAIALGLLVIGAIVYMAWGAAISMALSKWFSGGSSSSSGGSGMAVTPVAPQN